MSPICWCGGKNFKPLFTLRRRGLRDRFPVVRCTSCSTEFLDPMPSAEVLDQAYSSDYYGAGAKKFVGPFGLLFRWMQDSRVRLIPPYELPDESEPILLDVGCGNGNFLRGAKRANYLVEGTELSEASAARASGKGDIPVHVGALTDLDLEAGNYAVVTMWHVLEHLPNPHETLRAAHRLLERKGHIFIALPNAASWQSKYAGRLWFHRDPPRHLYHFSPKSLTKLLRASGFKPVRWWHFSLDQNPYGWLQGMLNRMGFPQDRLYEFLKGKERLSLSLLGEIAVAAILALPALILSLLEAGAQAGGTITVVAQKVEMGAPTPPPSRASRLVKLPRV